MENTALSSHLMVGQVRHRRFTPSAHHLNYPLFMPAIDLDELSQLQQNVACFGTRWWHWARFKRSDYLGEGCLKQAVQQKVHQLTGELYKGKVVAVVHLRYLGLYFSPVNFYYLYDEHQQWRYLLAEVSNTPWNERHYYAVPASAAQQEWRQDKAFHVSPFNPVEQAYCWRLKPLSSRLFVHLECHQEHKHFDATLTMKTKPFSSASLLKALITTPVMALKMLLGIYWHALRLWLKGVPVYDHPDKTQRQQQNKN